MNIIKRDGREVKFDKSKIEDALIKAYYATRDHNESEEKQNEFKRYTEKVSAFIEFNANISNTVYTVEDIQDIVEDSLMNDKNYNDIAKSYIRYRESRTIERRKKNKLYKKVKEKLSAGNVQNQNANLDEHSFGGRKGEAESEILRDIAINDRMSATSRNNHINNEIYIHDLDSYELGMHNCLSLPLDKLLRDGFDTRQTDVRGAKSVNTAFQLVAVLFQLQSLCQFGGVSATHIDWTMVPYVRYSFFKHYKDGLIFVEELEDTEFDKVNQEIRDKVTELSIDDLIYDKYPKAKRYAHKLTEKEIYQAAEGMYHNLR